MTIEETCRKIKEEIDAKFEKKKIERREIKYKTDHDSVMEALKFFGIKNKELK